MKSLRLLMLMSMFVLVFAGCASKETVEETAATETMESSDSTQAPQATDDTQAADSSVVE